MSLKTSLETSLEMLFRSICKVLMMSGVVLGFVFSGAPEALAKRSDNVIRIEVGNELTSEDEISKRELERRIYKLERAVRQLQDRVFELESKTPEESKDTSYTCYIETSFHGTITAESKSLTKAKAEALKKCTKETKELVCKGENVKCGE